MPLPAEGISLCSLGIMGMSFTRSGTPFQTELTKKLGEVVTLTVPPIMTSSGERIGYSMDIEMRIKEPALYDWITVAGNILTFNGDAPPAALGIHNIVIEYVDKNKYFTTESHVLKTDKLKVTVKANRPYLYAYHITKDLNLDSYTGFEKIVTEGTHSPSSCTWAQPTFQQPYLTISQATLGLVTKVTFAFGYSDADAMYTALADKTTVTTIKCCDSFGTACKTKNYTINWKDRRPSRSPELPAEL